MRTVLRMALAAAAALTASLGSAAAALGDCTNGVYDEPPPPIASITPATNTAIEQSYVYPVRFTVVSPIHFAGFYIRVSSRPQLGQTGILSDLVGLDDTILTESATDPDYYFGQASFTGSSLTTWTDVPGTYYWQLFGSWRDYSFTCHAFAGPINTITITPSTPSALPPPPPTPPEQPSPPPGVPPSRPPITTAQALSYATRMIRARTGRRPHIRLSCAKTDIQTLQCALRWSGGGLMYLATGRFTRSATPTVAYDFKGTRVEQTCSHRRRCSTRTTRFHWVGHS
jgi:hypothetical protein